MNLFEIGVNLLENIIVIVFLTLYFGGKRSGILLYIDMIIGIALSTAAITLLNMLVTYEGILGFVMIGIYYLYSLVFLQSDKQTKLFIALCIDCALGVTATLSFFSVCKIFNVNYSDLLVFSKERIIVIVLQKTMLILVCAVLLRFKIKNILKTKDIILQIALTVAVEFSIVIQASALMSDKNLLNMVLIESLSTAIILIMAYYTFIKLNYDRQLQIEYNKLEQKYELDKKYTYDVKELYEKACGVQHDLDIYFATALTLMDEDVDRAKEYLQKLIKKQRGKSFIESDNDCFNAVVNTKISVCESYGIYVEIKIKNKSLDKLEDDEIGVIFGNLFDNAIRASKDSKGKTIELNVDQKGEYLSIVMLNSIDKSVLEGNSALMTTKKDKSGHGFGTKNIRRVIEKHDGLVNYFEEDGYFGCQILV